MEMYEKPVALSSQQQGGTKIRKRNTNADGLDSFGVSELFKKIPCEVLQRPGRSGIFGKGRHII